MPRSRDVEQCHAVERNGFSRRKRPGDTSLFLCLRDVLPRSDLGLSISFFILRRRAVSGMSFAVRDPEYAQLLLR